MIVNFIATGSGNSFKRDESMQTHADPDPKHWEEQKKHEHGKRRKLLGEKNGGDKKTERQEKLMISP
jgi:hypothetical protein